MIRDDDAAESYIPGDGAVSIALLSSLSLRTFTRSFHIYILSRSGTFSLETLPGTYHSPRRALMLAFGLLLGHVQRPSCSMRQSQSPWELIWQVQ